MLRPSRSRRLRSTLLGHAWPPARRLCTPASPARLLRQRLPSRGGWQTLSLDGGPQPRAVVRPEQEPPPDGGAGGSATAFGAWITRGVSLSFLPRGYPDSVSENYTRYVQLTAVGLLAGRVQSVLGTQAALFAVGLGAGAVPMAAAVQWVLKDGFGNAAAIAYATMVTP